MAVKKKLTAQKGKLKKLKDGDLKKAKGGLMMAFDNPGGDNPFGEALDKAQDRRDKAVETQSKKK